MKVAVLSGGVGGARFLRGVVEVIDAAEVTAIVNVGDDLEVLGLSVSPDLDSVLYALADLGDEVRGWGRADETWNALATVDALGAETWFRLGDRDLGLHLVRTFHGAADARPAPGVLEALHEAELILIAPSNPFVSIGPILAVERIRSALERRRVPCVAVSPLIGGKAVKGPAAAMLARLEGGTSAAHLAQCYPGLIDALVLDEADADGAGAVEELGVRPIVTRTLMLDSASRRTLAEAALNTVALA